MSGIPYYLRLKPQGDSPEAKGAPFLIESQNEREVKFKGTTAPNKFTKVFKDISQLDLYNEVLQELAADMIENNDSVFFTLGPSNSGKSYTIHGDGSNPGLVIYCLNQLFNNSNGGNDVTDYQLLKSHFGSSFVVTSRSGKNSTGYGISISVFEVYNDKVRDLTLDSSKTINQNLEIITDIKDGKIKPKKLRQIFVANLEDAKLVLDKSIKRRVVSSTDLNQESSRSHLFIYLNLHKTIGKSVISSRITIADLAGSERSKFARTGGKEFKEGNYTNVSLTEIGRCLQLMKSRKFEKSLVRSSKLTQLLFSDANRSKIKILFTIDPYSDLTTITQALRYIQPVSKVILPSSKINSPEPIAIQDLQHVEELRALKEQYSQLVKEYGECKQRLEEQELEIRHELSSEFERKIDEICLKHAEEIDSLKVQHQTSTDERLDLLSKDYQAKIDELTKNERDKEEADHKVTELQKLNLELEEKVEISEKNVHSLEIELSDAQKQIAHLQSKNKKKVKKIEKLHELLENKRKAEPTDNEVEKSHKKAKSECSSSITELTQEEEATSFSPIKLVNLPSNKSKSPIDSPTKIKKKSESPKKQPLQETILGNTLSSPLKIKSKTPSKGKKKLKSVKIIDESFSE